jgi:hypothetical protein
LNHASFSHLEQLFMPWFNNFTPWSSNHGIAICQLVYNWSEGAQGHPCKLDAIINLELTLLVWTRVRRAEKALQVIFWLTETPLAKWMNFGHQVLTKILLHHPQSCISIPHQSGSVVYKNSMTKRHNKHLPDVAFAANGIKIFTYRQAVMTPTLKFILQWLATFSHCFLCLSLCCWWHHPSSCA